MNKCEGCGAEWGMRIDFRRIVVFLVAAPAAAALMSWFVAAFISTDHPTSLGAFGMAAALVGYVLTLTFIALTIVTIIVVVDDVWRRNPGLTVRMPKRNDVPRARVVWRTK